MPFGFETSLMLSVTLVELPLELKLRHERLRFRFTCRHVDYPCARLPNVYFSFGLVVVIESGAASILSPPPPFVTPPSAHHPPVNTPYYMHCSSLFSTVLFK